MSARLTRLTLIGTMALGSSIAASPAPAQTAALPTSVPTAGGPGNPQYPIPYAAPTPQQIMDVMARVRNRLEANVPMRPIPNPAAQPADAQAGRGRGGAGGPPAGNNFGPISYAMGVAYAGMLNAANATGDKAYTDFVAKRFQYFFDNLPAAEDLQKSAPPGDATNPLSRRNPFRSLVAPAALDDCGAIGASFIKAKRAGVGPDLSPLIDRFAQYIRHGQFRLADGTLARNRPYKESVWGDDEYMSVPFLAQMGALTGDRHYFDDAATQILQISQKLFIPSTGLFTHAWNSGNPDDHPRYYWGRANGWCMMAMVELLDVLPQDHPDRPKVIELLKKHAQAVASLQSGSGLWHQMLDRQDSYLETSCTGMFTFAMARAVNRGWLDAAAYGPVAQAGWNGLATRVTQDGKVEGVCVGTSYADDYTYYYYRPAADDIHGYGPVLLAGAEMLNLLKLDTVQISGGGRGSPVYYQDKARDVPLNPPVNPPTPR